MTQPVDSQQESSPSKSDRPSFDAGIDYDKFLDCVHCGLCTSACPTYLETGDENDSPRGRIYLMRGVTDGKIELNQNVSRHLELCLDCRSCETACPSGVQYGRLIEPFRVAMQQSTADVGATKTGFLQKQILHKLFPYPGRLKWALAPAKLMQLFKVDRLLEATRLVKLMPGFLQRMQRLLPPLPAASPPLPDVLPAEGTKRARVALFTGCVAEALFHPTNWATARVLQKNGCEVVIPKSQACCGAIHYHSGASEPATKLASDNINAFDADSVDAIIVNVAGCGSMLKDYGHISEELLPDQPQQQSEYKKFASKVRDIHEFLIELGPVAPTGNINCRIAYHDACHLQHAQRIREQPRQLLDLIPGLEVAPLPEAEICCGAAGSYNLTEPEMADRLAKRKLNHITNANIEGLATGNAGCSLQLQAALRQSGNNVWVAHPIDLLDLSYRGLQPGS